jgi:hypothetical protein
MLQNQNKGVRVTPFSKCQICKSSASYEECIVFFCSHIFHISCFQNSFFLGEDIKKTPIKNNILFEGKTVYCTVCNEKQKGNRKETSSKKKSPYN